MRRTPRSYRGTEKTAHELKDVLGAFMPEMERQMGEPSQAVFQEWRKVVGAQMAPFTEPVSFARGTLTVKVRGATLYSVLSQQERGRLLSALQQKFPQVQTLVFRV